MKRHGFTLIELLITITVIGATMSVAIPTVRNGMVKESLRSSRRTTAQMVAQARGAASMRACTTTLHFDGGSSGRMWIESCDLDGNNQPDTVGNVEYVSQRHGATMSVSSQSGQNAIRFSPTGILLDRSWTIITFSKREESMWIGVSPLGRTMVR